MQGTAVKIDVKFKDEMSKPIYRACMDLADFDHAAPRDELTRTQDLSRLGWCKVHQGSFKPGGHYDRERLISAGVCGSCDNWLTLWRERDNESHARIGGHHFIIGNSMDNYIVDPADTLLDIVAKAKAMPRGHGMGGQVQVIRFNDGRTVITNDLWHQGLIPAQLDGVMPNNAQFVRI